MLVLIPVCYSYPDSNLVEFPSEAQLDLEAECRVSVSGSVCPSLPVDLHGWGGGTGMERSASRLVYSWIHLNRTLINNCHDVTFDVTADVAPQSCPIRMTL